MASIDDALRQTLLENAGVSAWVGTRIHSPFLPQSGPYPAIAESRAELFALHLLQRKVDAQGFDLSALATAANGFSGAEIEQVIVAALYAAHAANQPLSEFQLRSELKMLSALPVAELRGQADALARELRDLDVQIQRTNWEADLLE